jgi:hypothetical protein
MTNDEIKGLRLRRTQVMSELTRINNILDDWDDNGSKSTKGWVPKTARGTDRESFYEQAERDSVNSGQFRNTDSNGNYITPEDC